VAQATLSSGNKKMCVERKELLPPVEYYWVLLTELLESNPLKNKQTAAPVID
jgi:hypothetical protein